MIFDDCCKKARREALACLMICTLCGFPDTDESEGDEFTTNNEVVSSSMMDLCENYSGSLPDGPEVQSSVANIVETTIVLIPRLIKHSW